MKLFDNLLNVNIQRLFLKGNIALVYKKIYEIAEDIATHEVERRMNLFHDKVEKKIKNNSADYFWKYAEEIVSYKEKRTQHHINEIKELLKLREQFKKDNGEENKKS